VAVVYAALRSIERKGQYVALSEVMAEAEAKVAANAKAVA
jgi:hypothetical protein